VFKYIIFIHIGLSRGLVLSKLKEPQILLKTRTYFASRLALISNQWPYLVWPALFGTTIFFCLCCFYWVMVSVQHNAAGKTDSVTKSFDLHRMNLFSHPTSMSDAVNYWPSFRLPGAPPYRDQIDLKSRLSISASSSF